MTATAPSVYHIPGGRREHPVLLPLVWDGKNLRRGRGGGVVRVVSPLWIQQGEARYPLRQGETLVGRCRYCTIVIEAPDVSRQHAALVLEADVLEIHDLGSLNGTLVNGERVYGVRRLEPDDEIEIGGEVLRVVHMDLGAAWADRTLEHTLPV